MTRCTTELFVDHSKSFRKKFFRKDINIIQLNFVIALIFALITFFLLTIPYFGMITIVSSLQLTMDIIKFVVFCDRIIVLLYYFAHSTILSACYSLSSLTLHPRDKIPDLTVVIICLNFRRLQNMILSTTSCKYLFLFTTKKCFEITP